VVAAILAVFLFVFRAATQIAVPFAPPPAHDTRKPMSEVRAKRPWPAGLEVLGINAGVWAWGRYVARNDYSRIGWRTWKANLRSGFAYDADPFFTNFIAHPYHGTLYFNAARSQGLSFWEAAPFSLGGSLMWELFGENSRPSINDAIMTTTGGIFLGELLFRLSSQVLDDSASGPGRLWREVAAGIIDPVRGLNRLFSGEAWRVGPRRGQLREPVHGDIAIGAKLVSEDRDLSHPTARPGLEFDMIYGETSKEIESRRPMDLIFLSGGLRSSDRQASFDFEAYGLWFGRSHADSKGRRHLFGLFQHFDYLRNEITHMGGTSLTGGLISLIPLGHRFELNTSLQVGPMVFGASNNRYTEIEQRDYNYGAGAVGKVDAWLSQPSLGALAIAIDQFKIYTFRQAALAADLSHDYFTEYRASYALPLKGPLRLRMEAAIYNRHLHFEGQPGYDTSESLVGASLAYRF
jgi:hypothetical protein